MCTQWHEPSLGVLRAVPSLQEFSAVLVELQDFLLSLGVGLEEAWDSRVSEPEEPLTAFCLSEMPMITVKLASKLGWKY